MATYPSSRICPCTTPAAGRVFPVQRPERMPDKRFTRGLVLDVGEVLMVYGFPQIDNDSPDFYALMWCLARFCYGVRGCDDTGGTR